MADLSPTAAAACVHVNPPQTEPELAASRQCLLRGGSSGGAAWTEHMDRDLDLTSSFRGRPKLPPNEGEK